MRSAILLCAALGAGCLPKSPCGDGEQSAGEACDDGNVEADDGCSPTCTIDPGWVCRGVCRPLCGDGRVVAGETCDDGNHESRDGCSATCAIESGWTCRGVVCTAVCGDGKILGDENCDPPDANNRCDAYGVGCRVCGADCRFVVGELRTCGDHILDEGEEACDEVPYAVCRDPEKPCTSCRADCRYSPIVCGNGVVEPGEACDGDEPCTAGACPRCEQCELHRCGDGVVHGDEECDDGNAHDSDGCVACAIGDGWECAETRCRPAALVIEPPSIAFGTMFVGETSERVIVFTNTGTTAVYVALSLGLEALGVTSPCIPGELAPMAVCPVKLTLGVTRRALSLEAIRKFPFERGGYRGEATVTMTGHVRHWSLAISRGLATTVDALIDDGADGVYIAGSYSSDLTDRNGYVAQIDAHAAIGMSWPVASSAPDDVNALVHAPSGGLLAFGGRVTANAGDAMSWSLATNGDLASHVVVAGSGDENITAAVRLPGGGFAIAGVTTSSLDGASAGGTDAFIAKLDATREVVWIRQLGSSDDDAFWAIDYDDDGDLVAVGEIGGPLAGEAYAGGLDTLVARYDAAGARLWAKTSGGSRDDQLFGVAIDRARGAIYAVGTGRAVEDPDALVLEISREGQTIDARPLSTPHPDEAHAVALGANGELYIGWHTVGDPAAAAPPRAFVTARDVGTRRAIWEVPLERVPNRSKRLAALLVGRTGIFAASVENATNLTTVELPEIVVDRVLTDGAY